MKKLLATFCVIAFLAHGPFSAYPTGLFYPTEEKTIPPGHEDSSLSDSDEIWTEIISNGKFYIENGLYDEAIEYFTEVSLEYPSAPEAHYYLGLACYAKGDFENAEKNLKKTVELNPYHAKSYYHLSLIEHIKGNNEKVVEYLNEVTLLDNTFRKAYCNKGVTYLEMDMPHRAAREFAYSLYLEPADFPSFAGFLEACTRLNIVEIDGKTDEKSGRIKFVVNEPSSRSGTFPGKTEMALKDKPEPPVEKRSISFIAPPAKRKDEPAGEKPFVFPKLPEEATGKEEIQIFLSKPHDKEGIKVTDRNPLELKCRKGLKRTLTVNFPNPEDLRFSLLKMRIKGKTGGEKIRVTILDNLAESSRTFELGEITKNWKTFYVDAEEEAPGINLEQIKQVKLKLLPPSDGEDSAEATVFINEIEII